MVTNGTVLSLAPSVEMMQKFYFQNAKEICLAAEQNFHVPESQ